ncbi:hypothetical protein [Cryobacterium sp. HLT2-28]|uniref:hypothetical protein n=1 Tax=Cryobacterium sp. HLT2-28 TaxID=1259146 RepID=UPI00141AE2A1|nr:hypothetical protein [Cryobacterium sp. HLT2-28]
MDANIGLRRTDERDLILVDGNWYVTWMSQDLIDAAKTYNARVSDPLDPKNPK